MPASPPVGVEISGISAAPAGWFVDYHNGNALEVACWGLRLDNTGAIPLVFDQISFKLIDASAFGSYTLVHSTIKDSIVTLLDAASVPGSGPAVSLGGLYSRKSTYVIAGKDTTFSVTLRGSVDGDFWFDIGMLTTVGVESEVVKSVHYVQAVLNSTTGPVTVRLAWS